MKEDLMKLAKSMIDLGEKIMASGGSDKAEKEEESEEEESEEESESEDSGPKKALIIASLKRKIG